MARALTALEVIGAITEVLNHYEIDGTDVKVIAENVNDPQTWLPKVTNVGFQMGRTGKIQIVVSYEGREGA